jgi:hypothetical protein
VFGGDRDAVPEVNSDVAAKRVAGRASRFVNSHALTSTVA